MRRQKIRKMLLLISFLFLPVTLYYFSPDLIIEGAVRGLAAGSMIVFMGMFAGSLIFGRAYCGWICPVGGLQEFSTLVVNKKAKGGKYDLFKYVIWVPWMIAIISAIVYAGGLRKIDFFYQTNIRGISVADFHSYVIYYIVIGLILVLALTAGRRAACHYICWMAPFMIIGSRIKNSFKWPSLCLKADLDKCVQCRTCSSNCPMSLNVAEIVKQGFKNNTECILCGTCADGCPHKTIRYSFSPWERGTGTRKW